MLNLSALSEQRLLPGTKGLALHAPIRQADIATQGWNILRGDSSFPVAVLKDSALQHNLSWMQQFCAQHHIQLAPHGKTTMCPQLFERQLEHGAWGITLATFNQVQIAQRFGVRRVLVANQLVNPAEIRALIELLSNDAGLAVFLITDSIAHVELLEQLVQQSNLKRPLPLLVELGFKGGRTGCRSMHDALSVARAIHASPYLCLAGIEGYEGLFVSQNRAADLIAVRDFVTQLMELTQLADRENLFEAENILLSAGGSAYFDLVASGFIQSHQWSRPLQPLLRSGCYVSHDHGFYHGLIHEMQQRIAANLKPALELWSMVQSRPEPDLAILTMGKRDASYDIDLPIPLSTHRPGRNTTPLPLPPGCKIEKMNDQHAYLRLPADSDLCQSLQIGDLICCGISHPCTTFDKWPLILVVDDDYQVCDAINTFF